MTAAARFTEADIKRAMNGARKAGFQQVRVGIDVRGNLVVDASLEPANEGFGKPNPLDRLLPQTR
jgi:hypothetical protein